MISALLLSLLLISGTHASDELAGFKAIRQLFEKPSSREVIYQYGKWCGVERGGCITDFIEDCNTALPCVDRLDCACKRHDICLTKYGDNNCKCDQELFNTVRNISRVNARIVQAAIALNPCDRPIMFQYPCNCRIENFNVNCKQCNGCRMRRTYRRRRDITYQFHTCREMLQARRQENGGQNGNARAKRANNAKARRMKWRKNRNARARRHKGRSKK